MSAFGLPFMGAWMSMGLSSVKLLSKKTEFEIHNDWLIVVFRRGRPFGRYAVFVLDSEFIN